jgi:deoxyribonuclease-4
MFGCHINGNFIKSVEKIHLLGGNLVQCFISEPTGKKTLKLSQLDIDEMKDTLKKYKMNMIIHAPYILNFAREFTENSWWIKTLICELNYANQIGAKGSVIHFGKYLHLDKDVAISNMVNSLKYVISMIIDLNVVIYLETSCGQGSELGYMIEEFAEIYNQFNENEKEKIKICIDTCHIFVAGYDIRKSDGFNNFIEKFEKLIGLKYIKLVHLNDSNKELESHVDRHDLIGKGFIGSEGLKYIYNWANKKGIDVILETGGEEKEIPMLLKIKK